MKFSDAQRGAILARRKLRQAIHRRHRHLANTAQLMGHDTSSPELMGGLLKSIIAKIQAKRAARVASGDTKDFALDTPIGKLNAGDSGFGFTAKTDSNGNVLPNQNMLNSTMVPGIPNKYLLIGGAAVVGGIILMKRGK